MRIKRNYILKKIDKFPSNFNQNLHKWHPPSINFYQNPLKSNLKSFEYPYLNRIKSKSKIYIKCSISGSFNKYFTELTEFHNELSYYKIRVLSPRDFEISDDSTGFIRLRGDIGTTISEIEGHHLQAIKNCNFLLVINPKNYIGISTALEIGYAVVNKKPIFFSDKIPDFVFPELKNGYPFYSICNDINCLFTNYENLGHYKFYSPIYPIRLGYYIIVDNNSRSINIPMAYFIGKMLAQNYTIFCNKSPKDILLKEILPILPKTNSFYTNRRFLNLLNYELNHKRFA